MRMRRHPLSGALYEITDDGLVQVDLDGRTGWFTAEGSWVRGDLYEADPHLCGWLAGRQVPTASIRSSPDLPSPSARR
ncbi:MAG TPA: hypothetical protein VF855_06060 [Acidimicrobiales bacterium]